MSLNRKVSARELRRHLAAEASLTHSQIVPAVNHLIEKVQALEERASAFRAMTFWQRLMWLCRGEREA